MLFSDGADFPQKPEEISVDWIRETLVDAATPAASNIETVKLEPMTKEFGMTSDCFKLRLGYSKAVAADAPATLFVKFSNRAEREIQFYQDIAPEIPLSIPRCYFARGNEKKNLYLLLTDDVSSGRPGDNLAGCSIEESNLIVSRIAELHAKFWQNEDIAAIGWLNRFDEFDLGWLDEAFRRALPRFLEIYPGMLPEWSVELLSESIARFPEIFYRLAEEPLTLVHGDLQLDNIMFGHPEEGVVFLDWELSMIAQGSYDMAAFLTFALPIGQRRDQEKQLVDHYYKSITAAGIDNYPIETFTRQLHNSWIFHFLRAVLVASSPEVEGRLRTVRLDFVRRHIAALEDNSVRL